MAKRLVKVAKELNVGTTTIVETLQKKGYDIKNRPTSKISDEMYNVLLKEFKGSIAIKEQADQLTFRSRQRKEAAEAARETERKRQEEARRKAEEERLKLEEERKKLEEARLRELERQREEEARKREEEERKRKEEAEKRKQTEIAERRKLEGPKILGKVNLDKFNKKGVPIKKDAPQSKKQAGVSNKKGSQHTEKKPRKVEKPKVRQARPTFKEQRKLQKVEPIVKKAPKVEKPKIEPIVNKKVEKKPPVEKPVEEMVRAETPKLKGLKIKGKIDLNRFNKPRKKEEKEEKKEGRQGEARVKKARIKKEVEKKTSSGGNDADDKKRRRRKRKRIQKPETAASTDPNKNQNSGEKKERKDDKDQKKPGEKKERIARVRKRPTRPSRSNPSNRSSGRKDEPKEVSQKEIEEKIKATMARLAGGGKSRRSKIRRESRIKTREQQNLAEQENVLTKVQVTEFISVSELANVFDISPTDVIMTCMNAGVIVSINQRLDAEIIELIAIEHEKEIEFVNAEEQAEEEDEIIDAPEDLVPRASIVTVMGHVDHGKTSLLDYIRKAKVAEGEAGGITQHIGAYEVKLPDGNITFLDTPGHEAFTAMRARGAKVTDIAIIIVASDDRIMPQTKEAISHAEAAGVPIVFAINKIDKPGANPEKIKQELAEMNYLVEDWGGKYQSQDISAKTGLGIEDLLEKVILEADILELKANPKRDAVGVVLEASLDKGRGYVTKLLVKTGTLKIGSPIIAGAYAGKVRAMFDENGKRVKIAGPAKPVMLLGLSGAPQAGDKFKVMDSDQEARTLASKRARIIREQQQRAMRRVSLTDIGRRIALGNFHELNVIVKGDVDGSIEALSDSLIKQSIESVQVKVIHRAVGPIKDSDILLASASDAIVIGFQVRPSTSAKQLAEKEGVEIKLYSVIYDAIEEIRSAIEGMLEPLEERKDLGKVEIREIYKIGKIGTIAGCYVKEGKVTRNSYIDIIRDGIVVYPKKEGVKGEINSLKRFKDDAKEVTKGFECGLTIKNFHDMKVGDIVESYEIIEVKQTLKSIAKKKKKKQEEKI